VSDADERGSYDLDSVSSSIYTTIDRNDLVHIVADRVSLPDRSGAVDMFDILPRDMVDFYSDPNKFLKKPHEASSSDIKIPKLKGVSSTEYLRLLKRLRGLDMIEFSSATPLCVNSIFGVKKDADRIRLIIDARSANEMFVEPAKVELPTVELLAEMTIDEDEPLFVGKTDISDFYHRIRLPPHLRPYFALPPVRAGDVGLSHLPPDTWVYPLCKTLPMGFSHSVLIAQRGHLHILDSHSSLQASDRIVDDNDR
jgi:hypothetical protein